jgi:hypothetical protein
MFLLGAGDRPHPAAGQLRQGGSVRLYKKNGGKMARLKLSHDFCLSGGGDGLLSLSSSSSLSESSEFFTVSIFRRRNNDLSALDTASNLKGGREQ